MLDAAASVCHMHQCAAATSAEAAAYCAEELRADSQALQSDGELHVAGAHDVLDLELLEGGLEAQLDDDFAVLHANEQCSSGNQRCLLQQARHALQGRIPMLDCYRCSDLCLAALAVRKDTGFATTWR